jgi:hypothetical protein
MYDVMSVSWWGKSHTFDMDVRVVEKARQCLKNWWLVKKLAIWVTS